MKLDLSTREGLTVAQILRGPDFAGYILKHLFTERYRVIVGVHDWPLVNIRQVPASRHYLYSSWGVLHELELECPAKVSHYLSHAVDAAEMLQGFYVLRRYKVELQGLWQLASTLHGCRYTFVPKEERERRLAAGLEEFKNLEIECFEHYEKLDMQKFNRKNLAKLEVAL